MGKGSKWADLQISLGAIERIIQPLSDRRRSNVLTCNRTFSDAMQCVMPRQCTWHIELFHCNFTCVIECKVNSLSAAVYV